MRFLLPFMAAVVPAIILPGFSFYFDITPKVLVLLLGTALALVTWQGSFPSAGNATSRWVVLLIGLQALWLCAATAFSADPALSFNGGNWRRFGLIGETAVLAFTLLVIVDCSGRPDRIRGYLRALVASGLPVAAYGIMQHFGLDPLLSSTSYHAGDAPFTIVRPPSTLGHASYFGTYLVYVVFAGGALGLDRRSRVWRVAGAAASAVAILAIVLSGTRAAMLGLLFGGLVLLFRLPHLRRPYVFVAGLLCAATVAAIYVSPAGAGLRSRMRWSIDEPFGGARPLLWRDSLRMSSHRLAIGYGPETFASRFPRFESVELAKAFPDFQHESPHNVFLDALTSQGVPGFVLFAAMIAVAFYAALVSPGAAPVSAFLAASLAAGVVSQQFSSFTMPTAFLLYLTVALIAGEGMFEPRPLKQASWVRVAAIVLAYVLVAWSARLALADRHLQLARSALDRRDLRGALSHYGIGQRWHPSGSSADLYFSRELANFYRATPDVRLKLQTWTPAFQAAVRAAASSEDRQNAFYNLAIFFATQNDSADTERSLRNSLYWAPNWFKPHWALSRLFLAEGRFTDAQAEARLAVELNGGKDTEVRQTLETTNLDHEP